MRPRGSKRSFIGDQILAIDPASVLYTRPFTKGYHTNFEAQREIFTHLFASHVKVCHNCSMDTWDPLIDIWH